MSTTANIMSVSSNTISLEALEEISNFTSPTKGNDLANLLDMSLGTIDATGNINVKHLYDFLKQLMNQIIFANDEVTDEDKKNDAMPNANNILFNRINDIEKKLTCLRDLPSVAEVYASPMDARNKDLFNIMLVKHKATANEEAIDRLAQMIDKMLKDIKKLQEENEGFKFTMKSQSEQMNLMQEEISDLKERLNTLLEVYDKDNVDKKQKLSNDKEFFDNLMATINSLINEKNLVSWNSLEKAMLKSPESVASKNKDNSDKRDATPLLKNESKISDIEKEMSECSEKSIPDNYKLKKVDTQVSSKVSEIPPTKVNKVPTFTEELIKVSSSSPGPGTKIHSTNSYLSEQPKKVTSNLSTESRNVSPRVTPEAKKVSSRVTSEAKKVSSRETPEAKKVSSRETPEPKNVFSRLTPEPKKFSSNLITPAPIKKVSSSELKKQTNTLEPKMKNIATSTSPVDFNSFHSDSELQLFENLTPGESIDLSGPSEALSSHLHSLSLIREDHQLLEARVTLLENRMIQMEKQINEIVIQSDLNISILPPLETTLLPRLEEPPPQLEEKEEKDNSEKKSKPMIRNLIINEQSTFDTKYMESMINKLIKQYLDMKQKMNELYKRNRIYETNIESLFCETKRLQLEKVDISMLLKELAKKVSYEDLMKKVDFTFFNDAMKDILALIHDTENKFVKLSDYNELLKRILKFKEDLQTKCERVELEALAVTLDKFMKSCKDKLDCLPGVIRDGKSAAGIRKAITTHFHCISCDRPVDFNPNIPYPKLSKTSTWGFKSGKPYTLFEADNLQQHSKNHMLGRLTPTHSNPYKVVDEVVDLYKEPEFMTDSILTTEDKSKRLFPGNPQAVNNSCICTEYLPNLYQNKMEATSAPCTSRRSKVIKSSKK